ncbi:MAG: glycosyltransferase family 2 protein [bacterium]|nr:glycosyltransferase family 2 protein [bacterium]
MNKTGIIVINYNNWADTKALLEKMNCFSNQAFEVALIDNNSNDQALLKDRLKKINLNYRLHLRLNRKNLGFARAVNQGLRFFHKAGFGFYLLLNNDTLPNDDFLECLIKEYEKLPAGSILSPLIRHKAAGRVLYGGEGYIKKPLALAKHINYTKIPQQGPKPKPVEFVSGCCMLFDKSLLDDQVWFDKAYFLYLEDVDFCLQAKQKGHQSYVTYNCVVNHKQSRSFKKPTDKLKYSFASNLKFAWKNYKQSLPIWLIFVPFFYLYLYLLWSRPRKYF